MLLLPRQPCIYCHMYILHHLSNILLPIILHNCKLIAVTVTYVQDASTQHK